jgi:hypothetical protein
LRAAICGATTVGDLDVNRRDVLQRYAENMGWTIVDIPGDIRSVVNAAAEGRIDIVILWRFEDVVDGEELVRSLQSLNVECLALAQSCAALPE